MHFVDGIAGSSPTNVVHGGSTFAQTFLLGEFLVKGEHGAFLFAVDVAGSATARGEEGVGGWWSQLYAGGGAGGRWAIGKVLGVHAGDVSGAAAASVVEVGGRDGGVGLGDAVGWHF